MFGGFWFFLWGGVGVFLGDVGVEILLVVFLILGLSLIGVGYGVVIVDRGDCIIGVIVSFVDEVVWDMVFWEDGFVVECCEDCWI